MAIDWNHINTKNISAMDYIREVESQLKKDPRVIRTMFYPSYQAIQNWVTPGHRTKEFLTPLLNRFTTAFNYWRNYNSRAGSYTDAAGVQHGPTMPKSPYNQQPPGGSMARQNYNYPNEVDPLAFLQRSVSNFTRPLPGAGGSGGNPIGGGGGVGGNLPPKPVSTPPVIQQPIDVAGGNTASLIQNLLGSVGSFLPPTQLATNPIGTALSGLDIPNLVKNFFSGFTGSASSQYNNPYTGQIQGFVDKLTNLQFPQLDAGMRQAIDAIANSQRMAADKEFDERGGNLIAEMYGRGMNRSNVAQAAANKLSAEAALTRANIEGQIGERELAARNQAWANLAQQLTQGASILGGLGGQDFQMQQQGQLDKTNAMSMLLSLLQAAKQGQVDPLELLRLLFSQQNATADRRAALKASRPETPSVNYSGPRTSTAISPAGATSLPAELNLMELMKPFISGMSGMSSGIYSGQALEALAKILSQIQYSAGGYR